MDLIGENIGVHATKITFLPSHQKVENAQTPKHLYGLKEKELINS